jgi:hypothetical protein
VRFPSADDRDGGELGFKPIGSDDVIGVSRAEYERALGRKRCAGAAYNAGRAEEREACAKLCEQFAREADEASDAHAAIWAEEMARRIRARGADGA